MRKIFLFIIILVIIILYKYCNEMNENFYIDNKFRVILGDNLYENCDYNPKNVGSFQLQIRLDELQQEGYLLSFTIDDFKDICAGDILQQNKEEELNNQVNMIKRYNEEQILKYEQMSAQRIKYNEDILKERLKKERELSIEQSKYNIENKECNICLDEIDINNEIAEKSQCCKNYFHKSCIKDYILSTGKIQCPICKKLLSKESIKQYGITIVDLLKAKWLETIRSLNSTITSPDDIITEIDLPFSTWSTWSEERGGPTDEEYEEYENYVSNQVVIEEEENNNLNRNLLSMFEEDEYENVN